MAKRDEETFRIMELRRLLTEANEAYYLKNAPVMSDREFDELLAELGQLEAGRPDLADPDSPTRLVGGGTVSGFSTVQHSRPMLSIDNTYSVEDVRSWHDRIVKGLGDEAPTLCCDPKIDGVAVAVRYQERKMAIAVTRGDGVKGDDITAQVRRITALPLQLPESAPDHIEVRGEIFMPNKAFESVNVEREKAGDDPFANARNATAGTLKSLDTSVVPDRGLTCIIHGLGDAAPGLFSCYSEFIDRIASWGLPTSDRVRPVSSIDEVISLIESFGLERGDLPYGIDGMVIRVDRFGQQDELGATSKAPRWCVAFKYPAEQGRTRLLKVDWQVGKNGTLTPRATMEPVALAGTTVQHATLHNIEEIRRKDIRTGDLVIVEKAGEIIPQVVSAVVAERTGKESVIKPPASCPACHGMVSRKAPSCSASIQNAPLSFGSVLPGSLVATRWILMGWGRRSLTNSLRPVSSDILPTSID